MTSDADLEFGKLDENSTEYHIQVAKRLLEQANINPGEYDIGLDDIGRYFASGGPIAAPDQHAYTKIDDEIAKNEILPRISEELIQEHGKNPIGQHSDDLMRVLVYFRRQPIPGKLVLIETEKGREWKIGRLSGERGIAPEIEDDRSFSSQEEAEHELFVTRVEELESKFE
jgi:hypothetical protein